MDKIQNILEWEMPVSTSSSTMPMCIRRDPTPTSFPLTHRQDCPAGASRSMCTRLYSGGLLFRYCSGKPPHLMLKGCIRHGGFPAVSLMEGRMPHPIRDMLHGICNTVYVKDVSERCDIRNNALASNVFRFILKDRKSVV